MTWRAGAPPTALIFRSAAETSFGLGHLDQELARAFGQRQRADVGAAQIGEGLDRGFGDQVERRLAHDAGEDARRSALVASIDRRVRADDGELRRAVQHALRDLALVRHDLKRRLDVLVLEVALLLGDPIRDGEDHDRRRGHVHRVGGACQESPCVMFINAASAISQNDRASMGRSLDRQEA